MRWNDAEKVTWKLRIMQVSLLVILPLTCTAYSISHKTSFTLAPEIPIRVSADCLRMAVVCIVITFIDICIKDEFNLQLINMIKRESM